MAASKLSLETTYPLPNSKHRIPALGFGVYLSPRDVCVASCVSALKAGYRHIDSAQYYENEDLVADAIKEAGIPREEVFITTKILNPESTVEGNVKSILESVKKIDPRPDGYVDLFMIHSPNYGSDNRDKMWDALEQVKKMGKIRHLGTSNFGIAQLEQVRARASSWPVAVNQIELHAFSQQREIVEWCNKEGILIEAYSPLVRQKRAEDPTIKAMAEKYKATVNQILIRYCLQKGWVPLPKSDNPERIKANADVYFFDIDDEDMATLDNLDEGEEGSIVQVVSNDLSRDK